jgi:SagB-type dehydrogenase family enzyme
MFALEYHEATKHHFNRFAQSAGYLDWATQPDPFRRFAGAQVVELPHEAVSPDRPYDALFAGTLDAEPMTLASIADLLRCSMGLSAWKQYQRSRWALRVNPSSGNLHPTEAYLVWNGCVYHYAPREHAIEVRCRLRAPPPDQPATPDDEVFVVALTSIVWREAWKYGERAFRYCQHDVGHAIGALRLAAARLGWHLTLAADCPDAVVASLVGVDRDDDFREGEHETPECVAVVARNPRADLDLSALVARARGGEWTGTANRLSAEQREWPIIGRIERATCRSDRSDRSGVRIVHVRPVVHSDHRPFFCLPLLLPFAPCPAY